MGQDNKVVLIARQIIHYFYIVTNFIDELQTGRDGRRKRDGFRKRWLFLREITVRAALIWFGLVLR